MTNSALTSLLYFLAFGVLFYWMMKQGGCGMHAQGMEGTTSRTPGWSRLAQCGYGP